LARPSRRRSILTGLVVAASLLAARTPVRADSPTYRMFQPDGPGPHPAVVFVSGCSGFAPAIAPRSYERTAEHFRRHGYVVVFADYLERRGLKNCNSSRVNRSEVGKDVVAAAQWLRVQPFVDPARISAIGWSFGGGGVLMALSEHSAAQLGLSRAAVFYPECRLLPSWKSPVPTLMLLGGADEVSPGDACEQLVKTSATPDVVKIVIYSGAHHSFDVPELSAETVYPFGTMGYNAKAAAAAQQELERFLTAGHAP
jgi:dienelactone hydrolase